MMRKTLSAEEKELLFECLSKHSSEVVKELDKLFAGEIDIETVNQMREAIGDEFAENGLTKDDEPNEYGLKLEDLIDKLGSLYIRQKEQK